MNPSPSPPVRIHVGQAIEGGPWSSYQKRVTALAAFAIIFDGFDNQLIGFAIPSMLEEWHVTRSAFAPVVASGLIGMALGTAAAGPLGDRFGRKTMLTGSVFLFGVATAAAAVSPGPVELAVMRFLAGVGIGAALPNAGALISEITPFRRKPIAINLTIVCVPLGGMIAGLIAGRVLPLLGWRALFAVGGFAPLAFGVLLLLLLPESPRFLVRDERRWPRLQDFLRRAGVDVPASAVFEDSVAPVRQIGSLASLLEPALRRDTLGLWLSFSGCLTSVYLAFSWLPTLLTREGLPVQTASEGLTAYNFGGVLGSLLFAPLVVRYGSRWPLLSGAAGAFASAILLAVSPPGSGYTLLIILTAHGFLVNAVQTTLYSLAAHVYPPQVRVTGMASAIALGRICSVVMAFAGATLVDAGHSAFYAILALALAGVFSGLAYVRNHLPAPSSS